ncbi:hypothetical protein J437_LFUL019588 [Ladona fulva]|uniref:Integrase catalytic domain-containing protein n=1 Tax=Ladona fulva TaxID=123851 RepID=A0A8K0JSC8_LADFU|nr:hypothetical protein J437_LFUL019588 [Ladona fulva]
MAHPARTSKREGVEETQCSGGIYGQWEEGRDGRYEASRYMTAVAIARKSDALREFKEFKERSEVLHGRRIKEFQTDQGTEYTGKDFQKFLRESRIMHRRSVAHTHQQNGLADRANLTLGNVMRCLLVESGVPPSFWAEALHTACHVRKRCPTQPLNFATPLEI